MKRNAKNLALLGIGSIVVAGLLFRRYSVSPSQEEKFNIAIAARPINWAIATPPPEKTIVFPADHSVGTILMLDWRPPIPREFAPLLVENRDWLNAQGNVLIPQKRKVYLMLDRVSSRDLTCLEDVKDGDIQALTITGLSGGDELRPIQHLTSLWALYITRSSIADEDLAHLTRFRSLEMLRLDSDLITDKSVDYLLRFTSLTSLDIAHTKITNTGALRLKAALPDCYVVWAGGLPITPTPIPTPQQDPVS